MMSSRQKLESGILGPPEGAAKEASDAEVSPLGFRARIESFLTFWLSMMYIILPSSIIFAMAVAVPSLLLIWGWTKEFQDVTVMFALGNDKREVYQLALTLIPVCAVYIATAIVFLTESQSRNQRFHPIFTMFCFTIPGLLVTVLFLMLGHYSQERPSAPFGVEKTL